MNSTERASNLLFLLGIVSLAPGCAGDEDDTRMTAFNPNATAAGAGTTSAGDDGGTDGGAADGAANDGAADGPAGDDGPSATTGPGGTSAATTFDPGGTTLPPADSGGDYGAPDCTMPPMVGAIGELCQAYGAKIDSCYGGRITPECIQYYIAYCQYDLDSSAADPACSSALEDFYACISALSCEELASETSCETQIMAIEPACTKAAPRSHRLVQRSSS